MRALRSIFLTVGLIFLAGQPALADKRVALVIGNSAYRNVAKLSNPANDAVAVATMFKSAGFDTVESKLNLTVSELRKTLRDFGNRSRDADVAVIYYAGHGIELDGTNYLIPVDATLETDTDVLDETLSLDRVLVAVEPAKQLRLVILDACRDNPFAKSMKRTIASRAIGRGLAKVEPSSPNTMIAFAAKAGSTASDGDSKNSPFAAALVNHLTKPGLDLRKPERAPVDERGSLHPRQYLLHPRRRRVVRIRPELQPNQLVACLSHARLAGLLSVVFVEECIWECLHNA